MPSRLLAAVALLLTVACGGGKPGAQPPPPLPPSNNPEAQFAFRVQPGATASGAAMRSVVVEVRDAAGARVSGSTRYVVLKLGPGSGLATLSGTKGVDAVDGVATFPDLSVDKVGTGYTLVASGGALPDVSSAPFDVTPGPPAALRFAVQPGSAKHTADIPAPKVSVVDAAGNPTAADGIEITLALASGEAAATLTGTTTTWTVAGQATFAGLRLDRAGVYTLSASAPGLSAATSSRFGIDLAWVSISPDGGYVSSIAIDPTSPSRLLAATLGGLWHSTDAAATWSPVGAVKTKRLSGVAHDPATPGTVWAWGPKAIWRSADGGVSWNAATWPFGSGALTVLALAPTGHAVYASGSTGAGNAFLVSVDGGGSWSPLSPALPSGLPLEALAVSPDGTLWARGSGGVYRLASGAGAWTAPGTGFSGSPTYGFVFHPTVAGTVYATTASGFRKTTDGGATWSSFPSPSNTKRTLWLDPASPDVMVAGLSGHFEGGVSRSSDGGATWTPVRIRSDAGDALTLVGSATALYMGANDGVLKSTDGGATWKRASSGLGAPWLTAVAPQPGSTGVILAGSIAGEIYRSADWGISWTKSGALNLPVQSFLFDQVTPSRVWWVSAVYGPIPSTDGGVLYSMNGSVGDGIAQFAGCRAVPDVLWVAGSSAVHRSTDGGVNWTRVLLPPTALGTFRAVAADPADPLVAVASYEDFAGSANGLYRTTDGGATWTLRAAGTFGRTLEAATSSVIWSGGGTVMRSADAGLTWQDVHPPLAGTPTSLAVDQADPLRAFAGTAGTGLWMTADGGATWTQSASGLEGAEVVAVAIAPGNPRAIYAATEGGLYLSTTGGF